MQQQNKFVNTQAEKACSDFLMQIFKLQPKGLLSESESGKIFSFESYLKETGQSEQVISDWCTYAKSTDYFNQGRKGMKGIRAFVTSMGKILFWTVIVTGVVYVLISTFMLLFGVSLWHVSTFISFLIAGPSIVVAFLIFSLVKGSKKHVSGAAVPIIKYFDNDELTFIRAKSRLFVEK